MRFIRKTLLSFLALLLIPYQIHADTELTENLESYLSRALKANPQLKAFESEFEAIEARIPQLSSLPDPTLQVTHFVESVQTRTGPQENVFMLSQRIPWWGKLDAQADAASGKAKALWYAWKNQQLTLSEKVSILYYEQAYTVKVIRIMETNLALLEQLEPVIEQKVKTGAKLNQLIMLKVQTGKVDDQLSLLRTQLSTIQADLRSLLDMDEEQVLPVSDLKLSPVISDNHGAMLSQQMEANNLQLKILKEQMASAEAQEVIARLKSYPDFSLGLNYIQVGDPVVNPTTPDAGKDPWGVTISVSIPIWRKSINASQSEALARSRGLEAEFEHTLNTLKASLSSRLSNLEDARKRMVRYESELLPLAQQAVENSRSAYEAGNADITEFIVNEQTLLELQIAYWNAVRSAWVESIKITTLVNSYQ